MDVRVVLATAVVVGVVTGCGDGSTPTLGSRKDFGPDPTVAASGVPTPPPDTRVPPGPVGGGVDLRPELVALPDLPRGWIIDPTPAYDDDSGCTDRLQDVEKDATALAVAGFDNGDSATLTERIAYFPEPGGAQRAFAEVVATMVGCRSIRIDDHEGSIEEVPAGPLGDESRSYVARFDLDGTPAELRIVVVRVRTRVLGVAAFDIPRVPSATVEGIAATAVAKIGP